MTSALGEPGTAVGRRGPELPARPPVASVDAARPVASGVVKLRAAQERAEEELEACRSQSWGLAMQLMKSDAGEDAAREAALPDFARMDATAQRETLCDLARWHLSRERAGEAAPEIEPAGDAELASFDERRAAVCSAAIDHLREVWSEKREEFDRLIASMRDTENREKWLEGEVSKIDEILSLPAPQKTGLEARYRVAMAPLLDAVAELAASEPIDYHALLEIVRSYHGREDELLTELFGESAQARVRRSRAWGRTSLTAQVALYADEPWSEAIVW